MTTNKTLGNCPAQNDSNSKKYGEAGYISLQIKGETECSYLSQKKTLNKTPNTKNKHRTINNVMILLLIMLNFNYRCNGTPSQSHCKIRARKIHSLRFVSVCSNNSICKVNIQTRPLGFTETDYARTVQNICPKYLHISRKVSNFVRLNRRTKGKYKTKI